MARLEGAGEPALRREVPAAGRAVAALLAALALAAGCGIRGVQCRPGEALRVAESLYFGTARATGAVEEAEWRDVVERSIAPRLPGGFCTWEAEGRWRTADGVVQRERAFIVQVVHDDDDATAAAIDAIVDEYERRFGQEAVLRIRSPVCARF